MTDLTFEARHYPMGFVAAIVAPALIVAFYFALIGSADLFALFFIGGLIVAGLHVSLLAVPIFALLVMRWRPRLWNILPASFLVGAGPILLLQGPFSPWPERLAVCLVSGGFGLSGGVAFWLVVNRPWRRGSCR